MLARVLLFLVLFISFPFLLSGSVVEIYISKMEIPMEILLELLFKVMLLRVMSKMPMIVMIMM